MRLLTKARIVSGTIFTIGVIGIAVRENSSYLVTRTFTVTESERIYPVWGDAFSSAVIVTSFIAGTIAVCLLLAEWLSRK